MKHPALFMLLACSIVALGVAVGCGHRPEFPKDAGTPTVSVSQPLERKVADYVDFQGRTDAPFSVDIRARVTGYLVKMPFKEGAEIKEGDVLFEIDDRPYKADLDRTRGELERQKAALVKSQAEYDILLAVQKENPKAVSQAQLNQKLGTRDEAAGQLKATEANLESAQLNYDWCTVRSPIPGQVSRYYLTLGNLANQDTTLLTTVVSQDPMYAYFDVDERTYLRVERDLREGKIEPLRNRKVPLWMGLADESGYPHEGYVDFANNKIDPNTGTITVRGVFANPPGRGGARLLRPGMFVRIRLPLSPPRPVLLVAESAIGTDQGLKYLLVVDSKGMVERKSVKLGPLQDDGLRVIREGINEDDWVIVSGLQLVRPRIQVETERVSMPIQKAAD